jgi:hypothetical protein
MADPVVVQSETIAVTPSVERASFALREIAKRNGFSVAFVYAEVTRGKLRTVRPGGTGPQRVLPEEEQRWLRGE